MKSDLAAVAGEYANAIFQLACESNAEKAVLDNLKTINAVIKNSPQLEEVLKHPAVSSKEKKELIQELFKGKLHDLSLRLLDLLCDKRRLNILSHIENEYQELWRKKQNIVVGTLYYAERPDQRALDEIKQSLSRSLGKTLELDEREDKSLIGGYMLRLGDQVIDGSLRGRLQAIEKSLLSV